MSDYYIIGQNRTIADISDGATVVTVQYNGTTFAYWRHSLYGPNDPSAVIKASSSIDGITWSVPVTALTEASRDLAPGGVVHNGTNFVMAVSSTNTTTGATSTRIVTSAAGLVYTGSATVTWTEFWAAPSDLEYVGGTYYLAATVRPVINGPLLARVKTSVNLTTWSSLGSPGQLVSIDNVWPRISVVNSAVRLVYRQGNYDNETPEDRILTAQYLNGGWSPTSIVVDGTGNPDICALDVGYAVVYQDQTIQPGQGVWAWMYFDGEKFYKRGTFSQGFEYGVGAAVIATDDGFAAVYSTRKAEGSTDGTLYYRGFVGTFDEPPNTFVPQMIDRPENPNDELENFSVEISLGDYWVSLSDGIRYYVSPEGFGEKAQTQRRVTASSPYYEGTYLVHAVRENVSETITVGVTGVSQNDVTENLLFLEEMILQPAFKIRVTVQDHVETWSCQSADYAIERGHLMLHNTRAMMKMQISRLPEVTYEVI